MLRFHHAVEGLSEQQKRCLFLRMEGLRYPEIGSALGISASAVGEFLRRAMARLKKGAMSSIHTHPEDGVLLRYLDGELPARKSRQVRGHLEACWQCRTAVEELEATVAGCVRYRKNVLQAHLPPPPAPWADLSAGICQDRLRGGS